MKHKNILTGVAVFLSIVLLIGLLWFILGDRRADLASKYIAKGLELEQSQQYKQSYLQFKKAQMATPKSYAPYYYQGQVLGAIGQNDLAIEAYDKSIQFASDEIDPTFALAKIYYQDKNYSKAEELFNSCLEKEPTNSQIFFWLGKSQMNQNKLKEAQEKFKNALKLKINPKYRLYYGLSLAYQDIDQAYDQIEKYSQTKSANLDNIKPLAQESGGEIEEVFQRMLTTESPATRKLLLGQLLNQFHESGLAIIKLTELTEQYPDIRDGWIFLGYGQIQENQIDEAIESLGKAKELDPTDSLTYQLLSKAYQAKDQNETAKEMLQKANMLKEEG